MARNSDWYRQAIEQARETKRLRAELYASLLADLEAGDDRSTIEYLTWWLKENMN
jgi:hypothetical protein